MEALTISQANLNVIAQNMESVAKELGGVINHINEVSSKVNNVENKIGGINGEINDVIEEIRSNTIINNARQSILYNNSIIDKKFGYYDTLRRSVESLIENLKNNTLSRGEIETLKTNISINNPRFWLTNATLAIIYWLQNNKIDCENELKIALSKDQAKTSLLMLTIYLTLGKEETAIHWLNYYLNHQDPLNIKDEFLIVIDLVSSGYLGISSQKILINKINSWINKINQNTKDTITNKWVEFIKSKKQNKQLFTHITDYATNKEIISKNIEIFEANHQTDRFVNDIMLQKKESKRIDNLLYNLIYDYEETEKTYQLDNLRNELLIQTGGKKEEAEKLFAKHKNNYLSETNILELFYNIIQTPERYNVGSNSIKLALAFQKPYLIEALNIVNSYINESEINFRIEGIYASTKDGKNINNVLEEIKISANTKFMDDDKLLILLSLLICIIGLIAVILVSSNSIISLITLAIILIVNFIIINKLNTKSRLLNQQKTNYIKNISGIYEKNFAECTDYNKLIEEEKQFYKETLKKIESIRAENIIINNERTIDLK